MRTEWMAKTVTDVVGTAGSVVLDADDTAWIVEVVTGSEITYEDNQTLISGFGIRVEYDSEWSAERTAVSLGTASLALGDDRGESGDEALAGAWWRCGDEGESWITDEADVEIAAEYLYAAAYEN